MPSDAASLDNLRDIVAPPPVSWWPPAPGWWFLMALACAFGAWLVYRIWKTRRANAYRRAALRELGAAARPEDVAEILKRTALAAYSRSDVAALSGDAWLRFLDATGKTSEFTRGPGRILIDAVYRATPVPDAEKSSLVALCREWIREHEVREGVSGVGCQVSGDTE
jgi:hypothetical protein